MRVETEAEGGGSHYASEFAIAENRLAFGRPRVAVFVVVLDGRGDGFGMMKFDEDDDNDDDV